MGAGRHTLVLGLGNTLLSDEGVGVHVIDALQAAGHGDEQLTLLDGGTLSFSLAAPMAEAEQLIVVDAAELDEAPGTVRVFENDAFDDFLGSQRKRSVHEVGLLDLLAVSHLTDAIPSPRALVAIQPESLDWGEHPSAVVAGAIPAACAQVLKLIETWQP